jgi:Flp pilus assembly protein TadD
MKFPRSGRCTLTARAMTGGYAVPAMRHLVRLSPLLMVLFALACAAPAVPPPGGRAPDTLLRMGDRMRAEGDLPTALALYRQAAEQAPGDVAGWSRLAEAYAAAGDRVEATRAWRAALAAAPSDTQAQRGLAVSLLSEGRAQEAATLLETTTTGPRPDARMLGLLAVAYDTLGRGAEATATHGRAVAVAPNEPDLRVNQGLSQLAQGEDERALGLLRAAGALPGAGPRHRRALALGLFAAGEDFEARAVLAGVEPGQVEALRLQGLRVRAAAPGAARAAAIGQDAAA